MNPTVSDSKTCPPPLLPAPVRVSRVAKSPRRTLRPCAFISVLLPALVAEPTRRRLASLPPLRVPSAWTWESFSSGPGSVGNEPAVFLELLFTRAANPDPLAEVGPHPL